MKYAAVQDRDGNYVPIPSNEAFKLESTWTFVTSTTGATGAHTLFTVTGNNLVQVFGIVDTDLTGAATLEVGVAGNTAGLLAQTANATTLDDGEIYVDATSATGVETLPGTFIINDGADILMTIGSTAITGGVIDFYCLWRPLSSDGNITVTTPS
jgi:hypothetical protein